MHILGNEMKWSTFYAPPCSLMNGSMPILYIYIHMYIFLMANKLCCCCSSDGECRMQRC